MKSLNNETETKSFNEKVWAGTGIVSLCLLIIGVFIYTFNVSLLLIAGVVLAVYLRIVTDKIKKWTGWKDLLCYIISIFISLIIATALFWLVGATIDDQAKDFQKKFPEMKEQVGRIVKKTPILNSFAGKYFTTNNSTKAGSQPTTPVKDSTTSSAKDLAKSDTATNVVANTNTTTKNPKANQQSGANGDMGSMFKKFFTSTFGFLGDLYTVFFLGLFLAATPKEYVKGIVSLVPRKGRSKANKVLETMGLNLRSWFKGMTYSVLITFALTAGGLLALGVDQWLILSLLAGLLTFIPNFGPIISLIPAVLVGFLDSAQQALYIGILYFFVQLIESNLITPYIQNKMLSIPAALLLFFQMLMGILGGAWGVVMATPFLVVIMTLVQELYSGRPGKE